MTKPLPLLVIVGPTAVGKTEAAVKAAQKLDGQVISGDSMQIYKYMDIGTAKPTAEEMAGIPHYMVDAIYPDEEFSVARFQEMVEKYIGEIRSQGKLPILVGGTGLYIRAVLDHYDFSPPGADAAKRQELLDLARSYGNGRLVSLLQQVDPAAAGRIHPNDTRRLVRALEVYHATGRPISDFQYGTEPLPPKYRLAYFGLTMNRDNLYRRIEQRVDKMMARGLVDEVKRLVEMGYKPDSTAMQALGYREIIDYQQGLTTLDEAAALIKRNTRRFAKRQLTWFRRDQRIRWLNVEDYNTFAEIADEIAAVSEGLFGNS